MITFDDPAAGVHAPDARVLVEVMSAFGLGGILSVEPLHTGTMNLNWRVVTQVGAFAVKQIVDADAEQSRRQHHAVQALAERGMPVPTPVRLAAGRRTVPGDTVLDHPAGNFSVVPWVAGRHRMGSELDLAESAALGRFLAVLHARLAVVLPTAPNATETENKEPGATLDAIDDYLALIDARPELDAFDADAHRLLLARRALIRAQLHLRPVDRGPVGSAGWTHGDFQQFNLVWDGRRVAGVLDWDRLRIDVLLAEVVRAAVLIFSHDETPGLDLDKVSAFVSGYRSLYSVSPDALVAAVHHWWWNHLCGLWELRRHYQDGDRRCDTFFVRNSALVAWWSNHHEDVRTAFTRL
jgi:Ser/Thr protein kinase RdoA (MazF antagonist)